MQKLLNCYKCGASLDSATISFRTLCEKCIAGQHCCLNCRFHSPGRRNECMIPDTDFIQDRAANNFCDEFKVKETTSNPTTSRDEAIERAKKLLGG